MKFKKEALEYHSRNRRGKIEVVPTKSHSTQKDLALAYSPGVAEPCKEIEKNKEDVYKYTAKGNLVAVISNGTAVLGLGDIGAEASKPVMEGKGLLFKIFADIDVFDIEVDTKDVDRFIDTVKAIAPTFGGINLEDIKAPEAFEIERRLIEELDIPVMHDDQHGTAIISAAALLNSLEIMEKDIAKAKIVINGAGAAAISCTRLYVSLGAKKENILMCDSKGIITTSRDNLNSQKLEFASDTNLVTLQDAMNGADVFIGLSKGNIVNPDMLLSMAKNPIVFAMANPTPEIDYDLAMKTRKDLIMATGRSDHPNQVNNVLGFPFIFRGALDVRATKINEAMKIAAVHAIAKMTKESVPEQVKMAYNEKNMSFGREYIIPKPFDNRLITEVSPAVAKAAMESGVAKNPIKDWDAYRESLLDRMGYDDKLVRMLHNRAKTNPKRVVLTNGDNYEIIKAAENVYDEGIAIPILLGNKKKIKFLMEENNMDFPVEVIDPKKPESNSIVFNYSKIFWEKRKRKGLTKYEAKKLMHGRDYFGAMMVESGDADAVISGYAKNYRESVKPLMEVIGKEEDVDKISSMTILLSKRGPLFLADTAIIKDPSSMDLVNITKMSCKVVKKFGLEPKIAMLSYSNFGSTNDKFNSKIRKAVEYLHENHPDMIVDGEIQPDIALNETILNERYSFSKLKERANTFIFPNLESSNISYRLIKGVNNTDMIGPMLLGVNKSAHVLQMKTKVEEIVNMISIAVIDAQDR